MSEAAETREPLSHVYKHTCFQTHAWEQTTNNESQLRVMCTRQNQVDCFVDWNPVKSERLEMKVNLEKKAASVKVKGG